MLKVLLTSAALVGFAFTGFAVRAEIAPVKIGYVDMQKAIQATESGKKAKKDLEKEFNDKKAELQETVYI